MKLHHEIMGQPGKPPVVLIHGLFGQGRNLSGMARRLAATRQVILPDLRNHGDSPWDPRHDYLALASDLADLIITHGGKADLAGHSMGGKAAMLLALTRPELIGRLAIMDIAPIAYQHDQTALITAMDSLDMAGLDRRSAADRRLAASVDDPGVRAFLLQSLDLQSDPPAWRLNLTALHDQMPQIVGWPDGLPHGSFGGPVLEIAGERSDYVTDIGQQALRAYFPQSRVIRIKGAGHWLHADAPEITADILTRFLSPD